jgi:mRNA interferase MazF
MVTPAARAIVLVRFPFSDLSHAKLRPTVVLAHAGRGDWILCQITSNPYGAPNAIPITDSDLEVGSLRVNSFVRPGKLFTASGGLMVAQVGHLKSDVFNLIIDNLMEILCPDKSL